MHYVAGWLKIKIKSGLEEDLCSTWQNEPTSDLKPYDVRLMMNIDTTSVSLCLDGTHVGRGSKWYVGVGLR